MNVIERFRFLFIIKGNQFWAREDGFDSTFDDGRKIYLFLLENTYIELKTCDFQHKFYIFIRKIVYTSVIPIDWQYYHCLQLAVSNQNFEYLVQKSLFKLINSEVELFIKLHILFWGFYFNTFYTNCFVLFSKLIIH